MIVEEISEKDEKEDELVHQSGISPEILELTILQIADNHRPKDPCLLTQGYTSCPPDEKDRTNLKRRHRSKTAYAEEPPRPSILNRQQQKRFSGYDDGERRSSFSYDIPVLLRRYRFWIAGTLGHDPAVQR